MPLQHPPEYYAEKHPENLKKVAFFRSILALTKKHDRISWRDNNILALFRLQLKAMRRKLDLSQQQMADAMQITRGRYCIIESGTSDISLDTIRRIATVFDCAVEVRLVPFREAIYDLIEVKPIPPYAFERSGCELDLMQAEGDVRLGEQELIHKGELDSKVGLEKMLTGEQKKKLLVHGLRQQVVGGE